jgi:hypothetical protein
MDEVKAIARVKIERYRDVAGGGGPPTLRVARNRSCLSWVLCDKRAMKRLVMSVGALALIAAAGAQGEASFLIGDSQTVVLQHEKAIPVRSETAVARAKVETFIRKALTRM